MRNRLIPIRTGRWHNLNLPKYMAACICILLMCAAFSGFSFAFENTSEIFVRLVVCTNERIAVINDIAAGNSLTEVALSEFVTYGKPVNEVLMIGEKNYDAAFDTCEVQAVVGENTFSLFDRMIEENEAAAGEVQVVSADIEPVSVTETPSATDTPKKQVSKSGASYENEPDIAKKVRKGVDASYLLKNLYIVDSTTSVKKSMFPVDKLVNEDLTIRKNKEKPQILIYHTHAESEGFVDAKTNKEHKISEVGKKLADILHEKYGYNVMHDSTKYDMIDGKLDRSLAYQKALNSLKQILQENPQIKVIIDLHRDGIASNDKALTQISGKNCARVMFFNGLSRNKTKAIPYLKNDNITSNLAFSLQMKLKAMEMYPGFAKPIYLKGYRYNLHLQKRCTLIELGNQNNTFEEACNSLEPLADVIAGVIN